MQSLESVGEGFIYKQITMRREDAAASPACNSSPKSGSGKLSRRKGAACSQLQRVFRYFDKNGDGKISPEELQSCVRAVGGELSAKEAEAAVKSSDMDGDGMLGMEDFEMLMEANGEEEEKTKDLKEAFGMYEMEGSGCITPKSLKRVLSRLGESKTIEDCKVMIHMFDINGDGVLSFEEFSAMMR